MVSFDSAASELLHHALPSHSPCGSTEPLVTFLTFFIFSITPDVVTLNEGKNEDNLSLKVKGRLHHSTVAARGKGCWLWNQTHLGSNPDPLSACSVSLPESRDLSVLQQKHSPHFPELS